MNNSEFDKDCLNDPDSANEKNEEFDQKKLGEMLPTRTFVVQEDFKEGHSYWNRDFSDMYLPVHNGDEVEEVRGGERDENYIDVQLNGKTGFVPRSILKM